MPAHQHVDTDTARRRRFNRRLAGCGCVTLVLIVAIYVIATMLLRGPSLPPDVAVQAAAQEAPPAPGALPMPASGPSLQQQVREVASKAGSGRPEPVTLRVTDAELNQLIASGLQSRQEVKRARAYFGKGKMYLTVDTVQRGQSLTLNVVASPVVVNGGLQFGLDSVKIGRIPAPAAVTKLVSTSLSGIYGRWSPEHTGVHLQSATIEEGVAVLKGMTTGAKPR